MSGPRLQAVYILAGGHSRRFGSDKALVTIDDTPLIIRLKHGFEERGLSVSVVADSTERYGGLHIESIPDAFADCGPLGGVHAALVNQLRVSGPGWVLITPADLVRWDSNWEESLRRACDSEGTQTQAVCFATKREPVAGKSGTMAQPIPGLFHTSLVPQCEHLLAEKTYALQRLLETVNTGLVTTSNNPRDWSFNSQEEFQQIQRRMREGNRS